MNPSQPRVSGAAGGSRRPVVLVCADYFFPGFKAGGPIPAIRNMLAALGDEFDFRVITRDRDLGDDLPYAGVHQSTWQAVSGGTVRYLVPSDLNPASLGRIIRTVAADILYINSLFSVPFSMLPLVLRRLGFPLARAVVVAPRGECGPGALALNGGRKRAYLRVARQLGLFDRVRFQASSEREAADIRLAVDDKVLVDVAPELPGALAPLAPRQRTKSRGEARLVFLGRISRMKNLDFALDVLGRVKGCVVLDVYGPIEEAGYWSECMALAAKLPSHVAMRHCGSVSPADVARLLVEYDALFLPTRGENFGFVIVEAMQSGCPVLISDRTRWTDLTVNGAGWAIPLEDQDGFVAAIDALCDRDQTEQQAWADGARAYAQNYIEDPALVEATRHLLTLSLTFPERP